MGTKNTPRIRQAGGFTIVELMVVIGLILALAAIGLTTMNLMLRRASAERTRSTLHMAKGLSTEYRAQFGHAINHFGPVRIDWSGSKLKNATTGSGIPDDPIEKFVWAVWQVEELRDRLRSKALNDIVVDSDGDGFLELIDGWNNQLNYAAYVNRGDIFTGDDFMPMIDVPFFMSRGPDEQWGTFAPSNIPINGAEDNIRSDEL